MGEMREQLDETRERLGFVEDTMVTVCDRMDNDSVLQGALVENLVTINAIAKGEAPPDLSALEQGLWTGDTTRQIPENYLEMCESLEIESYIENLFDPELPGDKNRLLWADELAKICQRTCLELSAYVDYSRTSFGGELVQRAQPLDYSQNKYFEDIFPAGLPEGNAKNAEDLAALHFLKYNIFLMDRGTIETYLFAVPAVLFEKTRVFKIRELAPRSQLLLLKTLLDPLWEAIKQDILAGKKVNWKTNPNLDESEIRAVLLREDANAQKSVAPAPGMG